MFQLNNGSYWSTGQYFSFTNSITFSHIISLYLQNQPYIIILMPNPILKYRQSPITPPSPLTPLILICLSLFIAPSDCQICNTCIQLSYYHCTICYNNCTTVPAEQFQSCQWSYCNYFGFNTTYNCFSYQIASLPENQCFQKCCNNSPQNYFSVDQLNRCQQVNTQSNIAAIASSFSIAGFFLLFFCVCYARRVMGYSCRSCRRCQRSFDRCMSSIGDCCVNVVGCTCCRRSVQNSANSNDMIGSGRYLSNEDLASLQSMHWQKQQSPDPIISTIQTDSTCTICLNTNVNTRTNCGHYFHLECLWEWFHRYPVCPLCKNTKANQSKFYCSSCGRYYVRINLRASYGLEQILQKIGNTECEECRHEIEKHL